MSHNDDNDNQEAYITTGENISDADLPDDDVPFWGNNNQHDTLVDHMTGHIGEGFAFLQEGQRDRNTVEWDFAPFVKPVAVDLDEAHPHDENLTEGVYTVTDTNGEPNQFVIFNPTLQTQEQPLGAFLSVVSGRYAIVSYAQIYAPLVRHCTKNGWDWNITCYDQGKKARMDIDVAQSQKSKSEWRSTEGRQLGDIYKYGVSIHNSLDGTGSLKIRGVAERLVCMNGMCASKTQNIASFRHTKHSIGSIDFQKLGQELSDMIVEVEAELTLVEGMKDINMTDEIFDKLLVAAQSRGILTLPNARPILEERTGEIIDYEIQRGHLFKAAFAGWAQPSLPWVKVKGETVGTAFHAYQVLTGGLTHKPRWNGPATLNGQGESELRGRTLNLKTLDDRLHSVHALLRDVANERIDLDSLPASEQAMGIAVAP